ncbi:MAG: hypothetical protein ACLFVT_09030 [Syntrophobacteria bacterium]
MIEKKPLCPHRVRKITGSFAFIEHRFLREGFFASLGHLELVLYLFLVLASDRQGLSYYSYDNICTLLRLTLDDYLGARNGLIHKKLIAFDGHLFQVLSLPERPVLEPSKPLNTQQEMEESDPATIHQLIKTALCVKVGTPVKK